MDKRSLMISERPPNWSNDIFIGRREYLDKLTFTVENYPLRIGVGIELRQTVNGEYYLHHRTEHVIWGDKMLRLQRLLWLIILISVIIGYIVGRFI